MLHHPWDSSVIYQTGRERQVQQVTLKEAFVALMLQGGDGTSVPPSRKEEQRRRGRVGSPRTLVLSCHPLSAVKLRLLHLPLSPPTFLPGEESSACAVPSSVAGEGRWPGKRLRWSRVLNNR